MCRTKLYFRKISITKLIVLNFIILFESVVIGEINVGGKSFRRLFLNSGSDF